MFLLILDKRLKYLYVFSATYFKDWVGVKWNKTMVDELKNLYSYQGKDAVYSVCAGNAGNEKVRSIDFSIVIVRDVASMRTQLKVLLP